MISKTGATGETGPLRSDMRGEGFESTLGRETIGASQLFKVLYADISG